MQTIMSSIMGKVCSLHDKMEHLLAVIHLLQKEPECSLICLTETWLNEFTVDCVVCLDGFKLIWVEMSMDEEEEG